MISFHDREGWQRQRLINDSKDVFDIYYEIYFTKDKVKFLYIDTLIIRGTNNRYKGRGTEELNKIIEFAIQEKCQYIELCADLKQPQAPGFLLKEWYKKFGFIVLGEIPKYMAVMRKYLKENIS